LTASRNLGLRERLIQRAAETAVRRVLNGKFSPQIIPETINELTSESDWIADYKSFVGGDPFMAGNPKKRRINQQLGAAISKSIGGKVEKLANGKSIQLPATGSVITKFTVLRSCTLRAEQPGTETQTGGDEGEK
jgi:hypothetical protein